MDVLLITDFFGDRPNDPRFHVDPLDGLPAGSAYLSPEEGVPTPDFVSEAETIVVLGPIDNHERAVQLAGALRRALSRGRTVVLAYRVRLDGTDSVLYERLVSPDGPTNLNRGEPVTRAIPAFQAYGEAYGGSCASGFLTPPAGAESLAEVNEVPAALAVPVEHGRVYVVPWHVADLDESHPPLLRALLEAVRAHQSGATTALPDFLADARLDGEDAVLADVARLKRDLAEREQEADDLRRLRHLLGKLQGDELEAIVIEALNLVLEGTDFRAEDRVDLSREDFWIVGPGGDHALAEVKAMAGGVPRGAVSQVDVHRSDLGKEIEELPALLVSNQFRGDDNFERRRQAPNQDVMRQLGQQNVLLLRTVDLYELVSRKRAGEPVGERLVEALDAGGGWLEATLEGIVLRRPSV